MTKPRNILDEYGSVLSYYSRGNLISRKFKDWGEEITEYDENNKRTYFKDSHGTESWYNEDGMKKIRMKFSNGEEIWYDYHSNGYLSHYRDNKGNEYWFDGNGNRIHDNVS